MKDYIIDMVRNAILVVAACLCVAGFFVIGTTAAQVIMAIVSACLIAVFLLSFRIYECFESDEDEA